MANQQSVPQDVIDRLKEAYPTDTRGLVKEVAAQMAAAGDWPASQRLRELIGRGSMSTINGALGEWKQSWLKKMGAMVDLPDLPKELVASFQTAIKGMWEHASVEARSGFDEERSAALQTLRESEARGAALAGQLEAAEAARDAVESDLAATRQRASDLDSALATEQQARRDTDAALVAERAARGEEQTRFAASARAEADKHADAVARLETERQHERSEFEGRLAGAAAQLSEIREKVRAVEAAYDHERERSERIGREARDDAATGRAAVQALQERLDGVRAELAEARRASEAAQAERAKALERAADAAARSSNQVEKLGGEVRAADDARHAAEAALQEAQSLVRQFVARLTGEESPVPAEDPLLQEGRGYIERSMEPPAHPEPVRRRT